MPRRISTHLNCLKNNNLKTKVQNESFVSRKLVLDRKQSRM